MRFICLAAALCALLVTSAAAQDVSGKWKTDVETPSGKLPLVFEFEIKGAMVTGTISNDFLPKFPIQDGLLEDNELSFKLPVQSVTLGYKGRVEGDTLTLTSKVVEDRGTDPLQGPTLGGVLRSIQVIKARREK
jgi:hypothetical protein